MEGLLKKSTAVNVTALMIDSADHITGKTGLAAGLTIYATKAAGTPTLITPTVTELDATNVKGLYKLALTSGHTDTDGELQLHITATGADPTDIKWQVGAVDANLIQILGTLLTETAGQIAAAFKKVFDVAVPVFTAASVNQTGDNYARLGAPAGASVSADIAATKALLPTALASDGSIKASVQSILGTAFTEGAAGRIAAAFKQFFNIASPAATMDHGVLVDTVTTLTNAPSDSAGTTTLLSRLTGARAGYLDNLNVGGNVAASSEVTGLNVNTRCVLLVPDEIETPDSSTQVYKIRLHLYDEVGNMEAPDSTPTVTLTNAAGTDRSSRLSAASNPSTGVYTWDYTATAGDAEEQLIWVFSVVEASVTRTYPANSYVVEESLFRFSSTDRSNLGAIKTKTDQLAFTTTNKVDAAFNAAGDFPQACADKVWSTATRALTDKAGFSLSTAGVQAIWDALSTALTTAGSIGKRIVDFLTGDAFARLGAPAGASIAADIAGVKTDTAAIKLKTDNLPASPAAVSDIPTAAAIADEVWEEPIADHSGTAGSVAAALDSAASAGDPWATALPGSYGAGTAGKIVGDSLDAAISSRLASGAYTVPDNAGIAAIKAKTDNLPSDPADASDVAAAFGTVNGNVAAVDAHVLAVKAKTDNLPAAPAAVGDIPTAADNADKLIGRAIAGGADGGHTVGDALKPLRNRTEIVGSDLNVYEDDGTTLAWTAPIARAPGDPLASINPA